MRDKTILLGFEEAARLQQYLYSDPSNHIQIENDIGCRIVLSMDENCRILCRLAEKPDSTPIDYTENMDCLAWMSCIEQLKEQPGNHFPTRWDEIWNSTSIVRALNRNSPVRKRQTA